MMSEIQAIILAIVEGLTEFLPISSTGHLIITSAFMKINEDPFTKAFNIIVQFGAILSVLVLYWRRFLAPIGFYKRLAFGFLPAAIIGLLVKNQIDRILGDVKIVGYALIAGGVALIILDRYLKPSKEGSLKIESLPLVSSLKIGIFQCLAFVPGVSRSAASIIGGITQGLDRKTAAEFSFFLAVPTLAGATFIKVIKLIPTIESHQWSLLALGNIIAFFVAMLAIKGFISYLSRYGFFAFGIYRIIAGVVLLILIQTGWLS
jgi:undecaprenyl-diphosphatase